MLEIEPGSVFERDHPFTMVVEGGPDPDLIFERWRPGAWNVDSAGEDVLMSCTALGRVKFTVISTHRPPGYQERVFFKREFTTPDGGRYAPAKLHNCIIRKFRKDVATFPFPFEVEHPSYGEGNDGLEECGNWSATDPVNLGGIEDGL